MSNHYEIVSLDEANKEYNFEDMEEMEDLTIAHDSNLPKSPPLIPSSQAGDKEQINVSPSQVTPSKHTTTNLYNNTPVLSNVPTIDHEFWTEKKALVRPPTPIDNQTSDNTSRNLIKDMKYDSDAINRECNEITAIIATDKATDIFSKDIDAYLSKYWDRKIA